MVTSLPPPANLMATGSSEPDVVVVCVTYNSSAVIEALLAALPSALESIATCRVVIVDNDSSDGTPAIVKQRAPWVRLIEAGSNSGYAGGINIALRNGLGSRGVYILNPDAVPSPGSVVRLLDAVESAPGVGIAVPAVLAVDGTLKFSLRREPTIMRAVGEALLGGHRAARFPKLGDMIRNPAYYCDGATADWATGAAMLVSRATIDAIGEWDERFWLYSEETDYALRLADAGSRLCLVMSAEVRHPGGSMSTSPYLWSLVAINRTRLYRKRHSLVPSLFYWLVVLGNEAVRSLLGRPTHRAAVKALLKVGPNPPAELSTPALM